MSDAAVSIRWHGQACVTLVSPAGLTVLVDPFDESIGHRLPAVEPDVVVATHNHYDHANVDAVAGEPRALWGLRRDGSWAEVDATFRDVRIRTVSTWHDEVRGAKRGRNALVVLEMGGLRVVHCGDLGHVLSDEQVRAVGPVDVLLIPAGGVYTVDPAEARQVVVQLAPRRLIVPIHFKTEPLTIDLEPVETFLQDLPEPRRPGTNEVRVPVQAPAAAADGPEVVVLDWRPPDEAGANSP
jgi:L-ascorbate metabolism protein UlaG (beta-lactamase superfamily)